MESDPLPSFATSLFTSSSAVKSRNNLSKQILDELIRLLRGRIAVEELYSRGLAKLSNPVSSHGVEDSLAEAVGGFTSDILNKSVQHKELADNLQTDVLAQLQALREDLYKTGKHYASTTTSLTQKIRAAEQAYKRSHKSYDRAYREAEVSAPASGELKCGNSIFTTTSPLHNSNSSRNRPTA